MKSRPLVWLLIVVLVGYFLDRQFGLFRPLRFVSEIITVPIKASVVRLESWGRAILFWRNGEERIKNLEQKNFELNLRLAKAELLEKENQDLRLQLVTLKTNRYRLLPSEIVGRRDGLEIDKGDIDGVRVGQVVVYKDGLVGLISKTYPRWSKVSLPTQTDFVIPAKSGQAYGEVRGEFGTSVYFDKVLPTQEFLVGDVVVTADDQGKIPPGLIIGKVSSLESKPSDVYKKARVELLGKLNELTVIFVVTDW